MHSQRTNVIHLLHQINKLMITCFEKKTKTMAIGEDDDDVVSVAGGGGDHTVNIQVVRGDMKNLMIYFTE